VHKRAKYAVGQGASAPCRRGQDRDVADTTGVDAEGALRFLREHLGSDILDVEVVGAGAWSQCFGFVYGGRDLVVRFGDHVDDFEKDRRASAFAGPALPVPMVTEIGEALDSWFAISTRAFGEPLELLSPTDWHAVVPGLFAALDEIRTVDISATTGFGGWGGNGHAPHPSWAEFLMAVDADTPGQRTFGWRRKLAASPLGAEPFRAGLVRLATLVERCPDARHVVHADLINRNVLVDRGQISAVFDWGCSIYGDFLYDIAWFEFWSPWHPVIAATDVRSRARRHYGSLGLDVEDLDERVRCYALHIGLDHLAYNAHTGDVDSLFQVAARMAELDV
jgi:hygromycin-B 4-O-kinase